MSNVHLLKGHYEKESLRVMENIEPYSSMSDSKSYPPLFRQPIDPSTAASIPIEEATNETDTVPVVDLHRLDSETLHESCKSWGLFRLVNHDVPLHLTTQLQEHARKLFALPFGSKKGLNKSPVSYFWGTPALTPAGSALKGSNQSINWVEGFHFPVSQMWDIDCNTLIAFRELLEEYESHLTRLASALYEAMAARLGLDPNLSKTYLDESSGLIRVYRYPPASSDSGRVMGMEVHTDSSVLSILSQDDEVSGLEVIKDERWVKVTPVLGSLVVNLGDMMQAMSNDVYKSVKHRVKVKNNGTSNERISICYFVFPAGDGVIRSLSYKPFCYDDFRSQVQIDIKNLGCKMGLQRFRLE